MKTNQVRIALAKCGDKFREYAELHQAKGTAEGFEKAQTNLGMALMCDEALAADSDERMTRGEIINILKPFARASENRVMMWDGEKHVEISPKDSDMLVAFTLTWGDVRRAQQAFTVLSEKS